MLLLLLACIPVPVLSPPARVSMTFGPEFTPVPTVEQTPGPVPLVVDLRAGLQPLGVFPDLVDRPFDVTAGLAVRLDPSDNARLGGFMEGSFYVWQQELNPATRLRMRVFGATDVYAPDPRAPEWDPGVRGGVGIEWVGFARATPQIGVSSNSIFLGTAWGEWALSGVVEGGWQHLPQGEAYRVGLGIEVQIPATAGVALVPVPLR